MATPALGPSVINEIRFRSDFDALAQFGALGEGGVHRPTFSQAHLAARSWFREQIERSGLEFRCDGAGNHSAFLNCAGRGAKTLLLGSHLDSVPNGGRFDGALGVVAALEVLKTVKDAGGQLAMNLEAIDFTDEEGTLAGLLGSAALVGTLTPETLQNPRGGRSALLEGMGRAGLSEHGMLNANRDPETIGGYLELHIEQGSRLKKAGFDIGIVTDIVGITSYKLIFIGRADHAGTTSMQDRLDAAQGASAFTTSARELVIRNFPNCVMNVGRMEFTPGAFNIVPERVSVWLEFRSADQKELEQMEVLLVECAEQKARLFGVKLEKEFVGRHEPTPMSEIVQNAIRDAAGWLGLSHMPLVSGAGHDAQNLAKVCPAGMIFVPSVGGASHSPREFTEWDDCVHGANVLLHAALKIAG
jgi:allantoate deiminase